MVNYFEVILFYSFEINEILDLLACYEYKKNVCVTRRESRFIGFHVSTNLHWEFKFDVMSLVYKHYIFSILTTSMICLRAVPNLTVTFSPF